MFGPWWKRVWLHFLLLFHDEAEDEKKFIVWISVDGYSHALRGGKRVCGAPHPRPGYEGFLVNTPYLEDPMICHTCFTSRHVAKHRRKDLKKWIEYGRREDARHD